MVPPGTPESRDLVPAAACRGLGFLFRLQAGVGLGGLGTDRPAVAWRGSRGGERMRLSPKIQERVRREFFPEDYARAVQVLSRWRTKACANGETPRRMRTAVLNLAVGNLPSLEDYIAAANSD